MYIYIYMHLCMSFCIFKYIHIQLNTCICEHTMCYGGGRGVALSNLDIDLDQEPLEQPATAFASRLLCDVFTLQP